MKLAGCCYKRTNPCAAKSWLLLGFIEMPLAKFDALLVGSLISKSGTCVNLSTSSQILEFLLPVYWSLFQRVQLTTNLCWFNRQQATTWTNDDKAHRPTHMCHSVSMS